MIIWLDAQLPPSLAPWIQQRFGIHCQAVRDLNLHRAKDTEIFDAARVSNAVVISKDRDFRELVLAKGPPPQVVWVTCGNTSNVRMQSVFESAFQYVLPHLEAGEPLIELTDRI